MPAVEAPQNSISLARQVAGASIGGQIESDKGGNFDKTQGLWVDREFATYFDQLPESERLAAEIMGDAWIGIAGAFKTQRSDANNHILWPQEVEGIFGDVLLLEGARRNSGAEDPFSVLPRFDERAIPFSEHYANPLKRVIYALQRLAAADALSARASRAYFEALLEAYNNDPKNPRASDLETFHMADLAWIDIPADILLLPIIEPTEEYYDPARLSHGKKEAVSKWATEVTNRNHLGPFRKFFEFRLLMRDESMDELVLQSDVLAIREKSRELFAAEDDHVVPVSLEFRRLLLASGQGSNPAKSAKNYPNFEDIRQNKGYKNILYTNMIREAAGNLIPTVLKTAFGDQIFGDIDDQQFLRGYTLRMIGHEENHTFRRHRGNLVLEELKATINGMAALMKTEGINQVDINAALLSVLGVALFERYKMRKAITEGDENVRSAYQAYYEGGTIMMNYLRDRGVFMMEADRITGFNYSKFRAAINALQNELEAVRADSTKGTEFQSRYGDKAVWDSFTIPNYIQQ